MQKYLEQLGALMIGYGPEPDREAGEPDTTVALARLFDSFEAEYAAIRRHVGILHLPQTGLIQLTGEDVKPFLHNMLSQDINAMTGGDTRRAFLLDAQGHILADTHVHHGDASTWLELDHFDIASTIQMLDSRLFAEDVAIQDVSASWTVLALLGPASAQLLAKIATHTVEGMTTDDIVSMVGTTHVVKVGDVLVSVCRCDLGQTLGLRLFVPIDQAEATHQQLLDAAGYEADAQMDADHADRRRDSLRGRPVGWLAYNTARIESGLAIYHIDFGPDSLPAEAGEAAFEEAVSLTKGCWLGQEAVARMHNLSHPKRLLVGLKLPGNRLPIEGMKVFEYDEDKRARAPRGGQIGGITSSTLSPMLGRAGLAFAVMKWGRHKAGTKVAVPIDGEMVEAEVSGLYFAG
ncbi:MAG: glycine cleavage T C-terminal barrel domain-containing protein [Planctomycetota bacterium]